MIRPYDLFDGITEDVSSTCSRSFGVLELDFPEDEYELLSDTLDDRRKYPPTVRTPTRGAGGIDVHTTHGTLKCKREAPLVEFKVVH